MQPYPFLQIYPLFGAKIMSFQNDNLTHLKLGEAHGIRNQFYSFFLTSFSSNHFLSLSLLLSFTLSFFFLPPSSFLLLLPHNIIFSLCFSFSSHNHLLLLLSLSKLYFLILFLHKSEHSLPLPTHYKDFCLKTETAVAT